MGLLIIKLFIPIMVVRKLLNGCHILPQTYETEHPWMNPLLVTITVLALGTAVVEVDSGQLMALVVACHELGSPLADMD